MIAAVEAFAERLRCEADHVPASARRADGLVALVNAAHATGVIPTRGGLPVTRVGHPGHHHARGPDLDHLPRAHPDRRGGPVHRVRRAGHPDPHRLGAPAPTPSPTVLAPPAAVRPSDPASRLAPPTGAAAPATDAVGARRQLTRAATRAVGSLGGSPQRQPADRRPGRAPCSAPGSRWPSGGPPAPPPRRSGGRWPPGTRAASSPGAASPPRPARPITSRTGPPAGTPTYPIWPSSVGHITARSTSACGPSYPRPAESLCPDPNPAPHPEPPGPATTTHPGPSPAPPAPAGGYDRLAASGRGDNPCRLSLPRCGRAAARALP